MTQQLTQEELRDELLSLFEENEEKLASQAAGVEKIEDEAMESFDKKAVAIKNKLINDAGVPDDDLQKKYLVEVENLRKAILEEVENKIKELVTKQKGVE